MGTMLNFQEYLTEELGTSSLEKVSRVILKYLRKKTGFKSMFANLGLEKYKNSNGIGYGLRYYIPGKKIESIRFNWLTKGSSNSSNLASIDMWTPTGKGIAYHI